MRQLPCMTLLAFVSGLMLLPVRAQASPREDALSPYDAIRHPSAALLLSEDSLRHLSEVTVLTHMRYHETILPQQLRGEALSRMNAHSVADALRHLSGLQLKDYGGLGGIKTINIRSMGSQHVGIYYDGIELGNAQNGQIDLGQLSLDNIEEIALYHGQRSAILQTASDFANAGSVYIRTQAPTHDLTRIKLQGGSSNLGRLSLLLNRRLSDRLSLSLNAEGLSSNGKYPFRYRRLNYDGSVAYDTTATRQNGDIQALRAEMNLFGRPAGSEQDGHWSAKLYTYHSSRGIPGAIVNNVWRRGERQSDHNTFMQANWQRDVNERYTARLSAKYAYYELHYQNRDTTQQMIDQRYRQQELYLTTTHVLSHSSHWSSSLSYDLRWNHLRSDVRLFADPSRLSQLASIASAIDYPHWQAQASLVYTHVQDWVQTGDVRPRSHQWTPALFLSYTPLSSRQRLQFRAFVKKSFRMPTFNDLYYTEVGNAQLRPESAIQYSIGLQGQYDQPLLSLRWSADLYHNSVHDKIVAYPKGQQFRWTMLNLGCVHIDGMDLQTEASSRPSQQLELGLRLQYTYQRARDLTLRSDSYYGHQIPYTPWHSGSATIWGQWRGCSLSYNFIYTGERYSQQENIRYNHLQPWYTSDLMLGWEGTKGLRSSKGSRSSRGLSGLRDLKVSLEINNILDQQYDVIINYPMPGRNYAICLQWNI